MSLNTVSDQNHFSESETSEKALEVEDRKFYDTYASLVHILGIQKVGHPILYEYSQTDI